MVFKALSVFILLAVDLLTLSVSAQSPVPPPKPGELEFAAFPKKNIDVKSTPVGTIVDFELLDAIIVGPQKVLPKGAILKVEVLRAERRSETQSSYLSLRIRQATWKGKTEDLDAYVVGQIHRERTVISPTGGNCTKTTVSRPPTESKGAGGGYAMVGTAPCAGTDPSDYSTSVTMTFPTLPRDVRIEAAAEGTHFVSAKRDISLKAETTLIFRRPLTARTQ